MTAEEIFRKNLSTYIYQSGKTQKDVAELIGIKPPMLTEWLKGTKSPRLKRLNTVAEVFGVKPVDLFTESEEPIYGQEYSLLGLFRSLTEEQKKQAISYMEFLHEKEV